jgi:hypothetical protein
MTYIIDSKFNAVKFHIDERICTFITGLYSIEKGLKSPCIIYITFNEEIIIYYDIKLKSIPAYTLIHMMQKEMEKFESLKITDNVGWDRSELVSLFNSCLYSDLNSNTVIAYKQLLQENLNKILKENARIDMEESKKEASEEEKFQLMVEELKNLEKTSNKTFYFNKKIWKKFKSKLKQNLITNNQTKEIDKEKQQNDGLSNFKTQTM